VLQLEKLALSLDTMTLRELLFLGYTMSVARSFTALLSQEVAMWKPFLVASALLLLMFPVLAQQGQTAPKSAPAAGYRIPPELARQVNPVKPTSESIARGKRRYGYDCAMCHGKNGDGKGDLAADMKAKVTDFTDPEAIKDATDGELFYVIKNGKGEMPPEGGRVKPAQIWNLVNYVRSFAKRKATPENR
jgi:mono/diheme cytochrome c family protein